MQKSFENRLERTRQGFVGRVAHAWANGNGDGLFTHKRWEGKRAGRSYTDPLPRVGLGDRPEPVHKLRRVAPGVLQDWYNN